MSGHTSESSSSAAGDRNKAQDPRLWRADGWTARVIKNEDDEGWAVEMTRDGDPEPALVGPWTMGRDKKNPKPLDSAAFTVLIKTASEVLLRHEQQRRAALFKSFAVTSPQRGLLQVALELIPDEDDPHAVLTAVDSTGAEHARKRVPVSFRLNAASAARWVADDFRLNEMD
jgi:hypothetical protein